jgi:imidazole glycerol phosphate synthase glutamine amidotransferase subunit
MTRVSVIDYGVGNLFSMKNALQRVGLDAKIVKTPEGVRSADGIILPGVGNFGAATKLLNPLADPIRKVVADGIPILGSCLGMQLLFEKSEEAEGDGLGLLDGWIREFKGDLKVPHMGWNSAVATRESPLLEGLYDEPYFYFVHSFYPDPEKGEDSLALTEYGIEFTSIVERGNVYGTQFHPEKSGKAGARLLSNFAGLLRK